MVYYIGPMATVNNLWDSSLVLLSKPVINLLDSLYFCWALSTPAGELCMNLLETIGLYVIMLNSV
jgi:hypothetical protein